MIRLRVQNIMYMFAANCQVQFLTALCIIAIFMAIHSGLTAKIIGLFFLNELWYLCCNLDLAVRGKIAFLLFYYFYFHS